MRLNKKAMPAPKGNQYALGNEGGRPPKFSTPEELQVMIEEFIKMNTKRGKIHVTVSGLAHYLGFESRQSMYDYEKKEEFSYLIKNTRLFIESFYEKQLYGYTPAGAIFALKNMGWKDKTETDITTGGDKINKKLNLSELTDEDLESLERIINRGNKG